MPDMRTALVDLDEDFTAGGEILKAFVDQKTGARHIVGVASGVEADRDGERVSRRAIAKMAKTTGAGGVMLTSSHDQDWASEIGEAVSAVHDSETDQLIVDTVLPPEGDDPMADKAWKVANTQKVGFSIGGKLRGAYFERDELGKKRKVLDNIDLKHLMLTKKPAYQHSFAEAVAKTWKGDLPPDRDFTLEVDDQPDSEDVAKDTTGGWANGGSDSGGGNVGRDSRGSGPRNAGTKSGKGGMKTEDPKDTSDDDSDTDADDGKDLPEGKDQERHLACPNCGHEFAADLPVDPDEQMLDDNPTDENKDDEDDDTSKSHNGSTAMTELDTTLDSLRALASVEKTAAEAVEDTPAADTAAAVEKAATDATEVAKMLAASHQANGTRMDTLEKGISEGFELIGKAFKGLQSQIADLPQGRKSVATVRAPTVGHDETSVEKTTDELIAEAPDALTALKISNAAHYGAH